MANVMETRSISGKSTNDCYTACVSAIPKAGFKVWKERALAWLVMAKKVENGVEIDANLSVRPDPSTPVTVSVSSEGMTEDALKPLLERLFAEVRASLE